MRLAGQFLFQAAAVDIFHDDEGSAGLLENIEYLHDIGVLKRGGQQGLAAEAVQVVDGQIDRVLENLDGDGFLQARMVGLVDNPHTALAQLVGEQEFAEPRMRGGRRRFNGVERLQTGFHGPIGSGPSLGLTRLVGSFLNRGTSGRLGHDICSARRRSGRTSVASVTILAGSRRQTSANP